ncbi:MAG: hypothetical protein AAGL34_14040, partial [Bacteroidota bacterium]
MLRKILLLTLVLMVPVLATAQNATKAKALLEEVYNKVKGYDNIYVDFKYSLVQPCRPFSHQTFVWSQTNPLNICS